MTSAVINTLASLLQSSQVVAIFIAFIALLAVIFSLLLMCKGLRSRDAESGQVNTPKSFGTFWYPALSSVVIGLLAIMITYSSFALDNAGGLYWTVGYIVLVIYTLLDPILTVLVVPTLRQQCLTFCRD